MRFESLYIKYIELKELHRLMKKNKDDNKMLESIHSKIQQLTEDIHENIKTLKENILNESDTKRLVGIEGFIILDKNKISSEYNLVKFNDLNKAIEVIKPYATNTECSYIYIKIINFCCYLLVTDGKLSTSLMLLEEAENASNKIKLESSLCHQFFTADELFLEDIPIICSNENISKTNKLVTSNMQMQAYIYYKLGEIGKFQQYENAVLQRQLAAGQGSPVAWAHRAASLGAHFLSKRMFKEARHHIMAACAVLQYCEDDKTRLGPNNNGKYKNLDCSITEVSKLWIKYGLCIFQVSCINGSNYSGDEKHQTFKEVFEKMDSEIIDLQYEGVPEGDLESPSSNTYKVMLKDNVNKKKSSECNIEKCIDLVHNSAKGDANSNINSDTESYIFHSLNLKNVENQVTTELIESTEQATKLFLFTYTWLMKVLAYCKLSDDIAEHIHCMFYIGDLYKSLAFFETDVQSKYNILKLRSDALESIIGLLRAHQPTNIKLTVNTVKDLAEVQLELVSLNVGKLSNMKEITQPEISKEIFREIHHQCLDAITHIYSRLTICSKHLTKKEISCKETNTE